MDEGLRLLRGSSPPVDLAREAVRLAEGRVISFAPVGGEGGYPLLEGAGTWTLFRATPEGGTYSHHGHIAHFRGVLYAVWSNHLRDEDAPGQRVLMRRSTDGGESWAAVVEAFPSLDRVDLGEADGEGRRTQCANGFAEVDGRLYALSEVWDGGGSCRSAPQGRLARAIAGEGGLLTREPFWVRGEALPAKVGAPEYGVGEPGLVERIEGYLARPGNERAWGFLPPTTRPLGEDGHRLCEPTPAWRLADGTWCRLYRDLEGSLRNYAAFSEDDGRTWSPGRRTEFPDAGSRSTAGTLPDGRVYVVSNIRPERRDALAISLSADGLTFDRVALVRSGAPAMRYEGRWKCGGFQYPHATTMGKHLWVVYSVNKEDVEVTAIPLTALYALGTGNH